MQQQNMILRSKKYYKNPVSYGEEPIPTNPDPYILKYKGFYYCYATNKQGIQLSVSKDLIHWKFLGYALQEAGRKKYWAPAVIRVNGKFFMYYSSAPYDSEDDHDECLRIAVSDTPEGPFIYQKTLFEKFSIDAEVVQNSIGQLYLFYSTNDITGTDIRNTGTSILIDQLLALDELSGHPTSVITPSLSEEIYEKNRFLDGRNWHTIEGASYLEHHDYAYLLYSANAYIRENYYIGYAFGKKKQNIKEIEWTKYPNDFEYSPLIKRNEGVEGTGHNSLIKAPNNVDNWIIYHGRDANEPLLLEEEQRVMRIDPLFFDGSRLMTFAPTYDKQIPPALPEVQDYFEEPSSFDVLEGAFSEKKEGLVTAEAPFMAIYKETYQYYLLECDFEAKASNLGRKNGVIVAYYSPTDYVSVLLNSGQNSLCVERVRNGFHTIINIFKVETLHMDQSYNIKVERCFSDYQIRLDDVVIGNFTIDDDEAKVGICSYYTETLFTYFSVTRTIDLYQMNINHLDKFFLSDQPAFIDREGVLAHYNSVPIELKGAAKNNHRYAVSFALPSKKSSLRCLLYSDCKEISVEVNIQKDVIDGYVNGALKFQKNYEENPDKKSTLNIDFIEDKIIFYLKDQIYTIEDMGINEWNWTLSLVKGSIYGYLETKIYL